MPRAPTCTVAEVEAAIRLNRGLISYVANTLKITPKAVHDYLNRHPHLKSIIQEYRIRRVDLAEKNLDAKLEDGDWEATKFTLKTIGKARGYTEKSETEITGAGGGPIAIETAENASLEEFRKRYAPPTSGEDNGTEPVDPPPS